MKHTDLLQAVRAHSAQEMAQHTADYNYRKQEAAAGPVPASEQVQHMHAQHSDAIRGEMHGLVQQVHAHIQNTHAVQMQTMGALHDQMQKLVALNMLTARPPQSVPQAVQPDMVVRDKAGKVAGKMIKGRFHKAIRTPDGAVVGVDSVPQE